jgi:hypothetical protein
VSVEAINGALSAINLYLEKNPPPPLDQKRHIESLTTEELEKIIRRSSVDAPVAAVNVLTMGLVHLKRLDLCSENSIKVYKIRRFY